ncbi:MAG TPA: protein translocase subunit SecF [Nitrospirota bacterium]|jgi:preprotein translocase subunit SecF
MELIKKTNIDFLGLRKIAFGISIALSTLGIICLAMIIAGKANMGIDFAGGASANLVFKSPVAIDKARVVLDNAGFKGAEIQSFTDGSKLLVRVKKTDVPIEQVVDRIKEAFAKGIPENPAIIDSSSAIGPTVGAALQKDALLAIVLSFLGIIIYIAWRFEFKFGVAATVATLHDVLAVLGVFLVLNKEITLLVVTALLTLAGYSLTDTVVVFDRIRENLKMRQKDSLGDIINSSINEVLSRTVVTSLTVFLAVLSLFVLGGEVLHDFAFAMLIGVVVGTYSSIFVASPVLYVWRGKGSKLIKASMLTKQPTKLAAAPAGPAVTEATEKPAAKPVEKAEKKEQKQIKYKKKK